MPLTVDKFPKLRYFAVENIFVPPSPDAVYQQLTALRLLTPGIRDHAEFDQILRSCQNVEELELEIDSGSGNADPSMEKITLPKLRIVRLSGWRWPLSNVFETLAIPPNADLAVHLSGPDDEVLREQSISAVLPEDYPTSLPIFSSVTEIHAQARQSEDVVVAYAPALAGGTKAAERRRLSPRMPISHKKGEDLQRMQRSLRKLSVLAVAPAESLRIDIEFKQVDCVNWRSVFEHFPLLRRLAITVQEHPRKLSRVSSALAPLDANVATQDGHETMTGGRAAAPCPRLQVLHLHRFISTLHPDDRWKYLVREMDLSADVSGLLIKRDAGCDVLEELVLDLDCVDEEKWAAVEERRVACTSVLGPLVGKLEYAPPPPLFAACPCLVPHLVPCGTDNREFVHEDVAGLREVDEVGSVLGSSP